MRSLKAVIIDDEEIIIGLIRHLGAWEGLGIQIVGTATDGIQGYALIRETRPDIVILDIRMPGLDGLEMVKNCLKEEIGAHFVIISGYQEFAYAKQAIAYHISDYLVKPIDQDELNYALKRICELLERQEQELTEVQKLQSSLKERDVQFWSSFFARLREGKAPGEFPGPRVEEPSHLCVAAATFDISENQLPLCASNFFEHFQFLISEKLLEELSNCGFAQQGHKCYMLLCYPQRYAETVHRRLSELAPLLDRYTQGYGGCRTTIGLSANTSDLDALPACFRQAERCLQYRFCSEQGKMYFYNDVIRSFDQELSALHLSETQCGQIHVLFERRDGAGLRQALETLHIGDTAMRGVHSRILLEQFFQQFFERTKSLGIFDTETEEAGRKIEWMCGTEPSTKTLYAKAGALLEEQFERLNASRALWNDRHIRAAKQYIATHYRQEIQLEEVAAAIGLNAAYLSSLFKTKTGMNYSEHLLRERMETAKQNLSQPGSTVKEVCADVGYRDVKYFSRLFRQYTGINPSLYQKTHSILP